MRLDGFPLERTVVVTGAASERGIGREVAHRLAGGRWAVAVLDIDGDLAEKVAEMLAHDHAVPTVGLAADISNEAAIDAAARRIEADLPPVVALANIAGISDPTDFLDLTLEQWERVMRINATGTFIVTKRFVPGMVARRLGRVVNMSSTAAQTGGGNYSKSSYAAAKSAIEGLSRAVAREVAPYGVTVNVVSPATIDTDIMGGPITEERAPAFLASLPVGRLGRIGEVAALIEHLLGPEAGYITGATYNINGGLRIG